MYVCLSACLHVRIPNIRGLNPHANIVVAVARCRASTSWCSSDAPPRRSRSNGHLINVINVGGHRGEHVRQVWDLIVLFKNGICTFKIFYMWFLYSKNWSKMVLKPPTSLLKSPFALVQNYNCTYLRHIPTLPSDSFAARRWSAASPGPVLADEARNPGWRGGLEWTLEYVIVCHKYNGHMDQTIKNGSLATIKIIKHRDFTIIKLDFTMLPSKNDQTWGFSHHKAIGPSKTLIWP
jgi:hypothetical protein